MYVIQYACFLLIYILLLPLSDRRMSVVRVRPVLTRVSNVNPMASSRPFPISSFKVDMFYFSGNCRFEGHIVIHYGVF